MKTRLLFLLLMVPTLLMAQNSLTLRQGTLQLSGGRMYTSSQEELTIRNQQFQRFVVDWAEDIENDYTLYSPPSFTTVRLSLGFDWLTAEESNFTRMLDIGISHSTLRGFTNQREYHEVLNSAEDNTSVGTFRYDSVLIRQQQIQHEAQLIGLHGQVRYYSKNESWLKGYAGIHLYAGIAYYPSTQVIHANGLVDKYYLDNEQLNQRQVFAFDGYSGRTLSDPIYFLTRLSLPLGLEARLWQSSSKKLALSFFVEAAFGGEYMTGTYGGLRPFHGLSVGFRYTF